MILWTSDTHLNFLEPSGAVRSFGAYLAQENPDATSLVISGDISSSHGLYSHLSQLADGFGKKIYYVTGNHDYYGSSFATVDKNLGKLKHPNLHWLRSNRVVLDDLTIVGSDNWYDARYGDQDSRVVLNDWYSITELIWSNHRPTLLKKIQDRADDMAVLLDADLCNVTTQNVLIVVHVPPYDMAAWHEGKQSDYDWLPWFSSRITGIMIENFADKYPDKNIIVLCGHTHGKGFYQHRPNLKVYTGGAVYGRPDLCGILDVENFRMHVK